MLLFCCGLGDHDNPPPAATTACSQKIRDTSAVVSTTAESPLESVPDDIVRAHLLALFTKESGLGFKLSPFPDWVCEWMTTEGVTVGLGFGSSLCHPHTCQYCGTDVGNLATHRLSCKKSERRMVRPMTFYIYLTTACILSRMEPSGLDHIGSIQIYGVTMIPWKNGKPPVYDMTFPDTLALS